MVGKADYLELGSWNAVCWECGRKRKSSQLVKNDDGRWVCPEHNDPRHPQEFVRAVPAEQPPPWVQPMPTDILLAQCGPVERSGIAGYATADCAVPELLPAGFEDLAQWTEVPVTITNLLHWSEDFTNDGVLCTGAGCWGTTNGAYVEGTNLIKLPIAVPTADIGQQALPTFDPANKTITGQWKLSGSGTLRIYMSNGVDDTSPLVVVTLTPVPTVYHVTYTFNSTPGLANLHLRREVGDTAVEVTAHFAQLEYAAGPGPYVKTTNSAPITQTLIT